MYNRHYKELAIYMLSGCTENCADCKYAGDGEFECTIAAIIDLLARVEAAEARAEKAERCIDEIQSARDHTRPAYVVDQILREWRGQKEE